MNENPEFISLGTTLTIADIADVYAKILNQLAHEQTVNIDISKVERIDTSGLQLLYCLSLYSKANKIPVSWSLMSDEFEYSAQLIGLSTDSFTTNSQQN